MQKKPAITSTGDFSKTILSAQTPQMDPITFTQADFLNALKKVSRKEPDQPPPDSGEEKPKE